MSVNMASRDAPQGESVIDAGLTEQVFSGFQRLIFDAAGISMSAAKKPLVSGRLAKRVRALNLPGFEAYYQHVSGAQGASDGELQHCIDLLTTNETYFFRENQHFDFLKKTVLPQRTSSKRLRIWSSASSSGEEAYTLAMVLADYLGVEGDWEILGTDISTRMIDAAQRAIYSEHRVRGVSREYRHRYLMRGTGRNQGSVGVVPELKKHVTFESYNLVSSARKSPQFDVIFCRNVLIYFNAETKAKVIRRLCDSLLPGGYLITGHSESLLGSIPFLQSVIPSVYQIKGAR